MQSSVIDEFTDRIKNSPELGKLPPTFRAAIRARVKWLSISLDHQLPPPDEGDWSVWLLLAGRGAGKTRSAAEAIWWYGWSQPGTRWLVSAPTSGDIRDVCFEGESGLISVCPPEIIETYSKSLHEIVLKNGTIIKGIAASEPERLRGPQFHGGWCDELAAWEYLDDAWDMIQFGMRLGSKPRILCTTTPKPKPLIADLVKRKKSVICTRASTYSNIDNLAPSFKDQILLYEGTQLGRQEIHAEVLNPEESGIIKREWFELWPHDKVLPAFEYIVMSLDTAFSEQTTNKKSHDPDPTACSVWGVFRHEKKPAFLLLDCWEERLGMPALIERVRKEYQVRYGDDDSKPMIAPMFGPKQSQFGGRKPDLLVIEDKGSGISLRQMLAREDILAYPYNPGRADKLQRLHAVSHLFAHKYVWVVESEKKHGTPKSWADPLITQVCSFYGEGSIKHDDYVDSTTQALRLLADRNQISVTRKTDDNDKAHRRSPPSKAVNPYSA